MAGTGEEQDSAVANTRAHTGSCVPGRILMSKFFPGNSQSTAFPYFFFLSKKYIPVGYRNPHTQYNQCHG